MPQIERLGLLGSLGNDMGYTGDDTGDSGRLKVNYILSTIPKYVLIKTG
jgi:hypothetical protein